MVSISDYIATKLFGTVDSSSTQQTIILEGNGYIYRLSSFVNSLIPKISYPTLDVVYSAGVTGYSAQLLLFNRTLQTQPFSGILLTYDKFTTPPTTLTAQYSIPKFSSLSSLTGIFNILMVNDVGNETWVSSVSSSNNSFVFMTNQTNKVYAVATTN